MDDYDLELDARHEEKEALRKEVTSLRAETQLALEQSRSAKQMMGSLAGDCESTLAEREAYINTLKAMIVDQDRTLAETQEKLKEAEKRVEQLTEINNGLHGVFTHNLALQAHVEKLREGLEETATIFDDLDTVQWDENGCPVTYHGTQEKIIKLLSSQPELPLIEEVREGIQSLVERFRTWDAGGQTSYGYVYGGHIHVAGNLRDEWYRDADQLLTRLNPRK